MENYEKNCPEKAVKSFRGNSKAAGAQQKCGLECLESSQEHGPPIGLETL